MSVLRSLAIIAGPWLTLAYVSWVGFHWTLIGLGCIDGLSILIATAALIDRELHPRASDGDDGD